MSQEPMYYARHKLCAGVNAGWAVRRHTPDDAYLPSRRSRFECQNHLRDAPAKVMSVLKCTTYRCAGGIAFWALSLASGIPVA